MAWEENRRLRCELARVVLFEAMEKDGAIFPEGTEGDQIRKVVRDLPTCLVEIINSNLLLIIIVCICHFKYIIRSRLPK